MSESPPDPEKGKAASGQKAAPMVKQIDEKQLQERREHVKRRLTLLSYHRSHWLGNPRAAVSINLYVQKCLGK
jgi:hypothetical protein